MISDAPNLLLIHATQTYKVALQSVKTFSFFSFTNYNEGKLMAACSSLWLIVGLQQRQMVSFDFVQRNLRLVELVVN